MKHTLDLILVREAKVLVLGREIAHRDERGPHKAAVPWQALEEALALDAAVVLSNGLVVLGGAKEGARCCYDCHDATVHRLQCTVPHKDVHSIVAVTSSGGQKVKKHAPSNFILPGRPPRSRQASLGPARRSGQRLSDRPAPRSGCRPGWKPLRSPGSRPRPRQSPGSRQEAGQRGPGRGGVGHTRCTLSHTHQ